MKIADIKSNLLDLARCETCGVREGSLCSGMSDDEFSHINLSIEDIKFPVGAALFQQGDVGKYIFSIRQGMVKLNRIRANGGQRIMRILRPGDVGGLEVIVANYYEYDAIALEPVFACRIPVSVIRQLDSESPILHKKLLERWHQTVIEADEWMSELTSGTARARLARLFLKMRNPVQLDVSTIFSRDDIGSMLCMTMETASRTINAFQREGKITSLDAGGRFYRIDVSALEVEITDLD
jgi:CRP/FNR family transcriptional regulator, anaerobic regulatory protein